MAADRTTLVILGASGDLTSRLLLPGIATLLRAQPSRSLEIVGADLRDLGQDEWRERVRTAMTLAHGAGDDAELGAGARQVVETTRYVAGDATDATALRALLDGVDCDRLVLYFALPPQISRKVCEALVEVGAPKGAILAIEKPFGSSLADARDLNALVQRIVPEDQIFRIDHFLGLYTVLNLLGMRFANRILAPLWDRESIERVEIVYDETVALEGRAGYYDSAGALRDMIQSHLLQVLALVAIEPPATVDARDLRDAIGQVLRAARVEDPTRDARRARYTAGRIGERHVPDYVEEESVDAARGTETLAEVTVHVENQRWAGVPFVLRSGKAMGRIRKQAVIHFREPAHVPHGFGGRREGDRLVLDFRPDSFAIHLTTNGKGDPFTLEQSVLRGELGGGQLEPYGEVLASILDGDPRLAVRADAAEECWRIVEPVLRAWKRDEVPLAEYRAGGTGPRGWASNGPSKE
ncbi:glucose-6-phosphate dehydrogenase [Agrococcus sp. SGAir0287]|uniref:glucose-6-phosphate dehydrogenase n=1 Tax=Agrococcus sp. SGAir0287 TaxID=2070347 RepID=UPI0010CCB6F1|nr:glucose-6-phosphate dehydrogenase [Agrococcus sp. SGAir0287]QCR18204.1 glucose-6-phosphate dehydrogenase [Agrococcus sp. SGAir0287]